VVARTVCMQPHRSKTGLVTAALRGMRFRVTTFAIMEAVQWVASAGASVYWLKCRTDRSGNDA
jgi:hypothetical protein